MTKNGLNSKAEHRKSDATVKMERTAHVSAVQRFIELVKYLSKFLQKGFRNVRANAPPDTQDC